MAIWNTETPKQTGDYLVLLEDGSKEKAHFFKCQMTGQMEWSRPDGSYIYENVIGWVMCDAE